MTPFEKALEFVLAREGGYSNDPNDPGGETKYGICKKYHPELDIKNLTIRQAGEIYRREYWDPNRCDELPYWAALAVFDTAVNMGKAHAQVCLQKTARVPDSGKNGAELYRIIQRMDPQEGMADYISYRLVRYAGLAGWQHYGRGWARRCALLAMEVSDGQAMV
jgi:lysozyme family protein